MPAREGAELIALALDPRAEPPADATSDRILDAALSLSAASGVRNLTMDDVARRAGVGRMTVYRRFGDKAGLVAALAAREGGRCLAELDAAVDLADPIADQIADGFVATLRIAREHPMLNRLARLEPESVLGTFAASDAAIFGLAREFLAARLRIAQESGQLAELPVDEAAEILVRLGLSFVLIQPSVLPLHDTARVRALAKQLIAPVLTGSSR
jgi:TetR/AcrR family transcriptional repressor of uid operon